MTEISKEYACALFMLAAEENLEKEISEALRSISGILKETPEYLDLLASPNIPLSERLQAVDEAFSNNMPEYAVSFLKLLCERGHIRLFHKCVSEYEELYHAADGISTAKVISAAPMSKNEKAALKEKLEAYTGHAVIMEYSVNKALLGGVIVRIDGKILDGSLRRRLHDIKEVMHL